MTSAVTLQNKNENNGRVLGEQGFDPTRPTINPESPIKHPEPQQQSKPTSTAPTPPQPKKGPCNTCNAVGRTGPCPGHGDAGGGDDAGAHGDDHDADIDAKQAAALNEKLELERLIDAFEFTVNPENGSLSIAPRPGANLTPEEIEKFFAKLDQHFDAFQKQYPEAEGFSRELINGVLTYTIPAQHYPEFIQSLVNAGLAPVSVLQQFSNPNVNNLQLQPLAQNNPVNTVQQQTLAQNNPTNNVQLQSSAQNNPIHENVTRSPLLRNSLFAYNPPAFSSGSKEQEKSGEFQFMRPHAPTPLPIEGK